MSSLFNHPMVIHEQWENFTETDHHTWRTLFARQTQLLKNRAADEVITGIEKLIMDPDHIPKFSELNASLQKETGFSILPVTGLIPEDLFFQCLAERYFPSTCFIRKPEQLDYLEEPDIFHDIFGHIPLLANPIFADFMETFGKKGLEAMKLNMLPFAARLYWFTVEFGLIQTSHGLRIYGAGITSSQGESFYSLDSNTPIRIKFNLPRLMKTQYHTDTFQKTYFVIDSFQQLFDAIKQLNWHDVQNTCLFFPDIAQGIMINPEENVENKGE